MIINTSIFMNHENGKVDPDITKKDKKSCVEQSERITNKKQPDGFTS